MTMRARWESGARLLLVSNLDPASPGQPGDPAINVTSWCPASTLLDSWANSDDLATMWDFNQEVVDSFQKANDTLFKCAASLTPSVTAGASACPTRTLRFRPGSAKLRPRVRWLIWLCCCQ
jgi:hypothetical protein